MLARRINRPEDELQPLLETFDRQDPKRVTWTEFLDWFNLEGRIRDKIHDARLYDHGLTRIVEEGNIVFKA